MSQLTLPRQLIVETLYDQGIDTLNDYLLRKGLTEAADLLNGIVWAQQLANGLAVTIDENASGFLESGCFALVALRRTHE